MDIVHIVLEMDPAKGKNVEDIDLGNLEYRAQDSLDNHKHSGTVDNSAAVRRVDIVDKHLLEVVNMLVDQEEEEDEDKEPRLEVRGYEFQVDCWDLACWTLESYSVSFSRIEEYENAYRFRMTWLLRTNSLSLRTSGGYCQEQHTGGGPSGGICNEMIMMSA